MEINKKIIKNAIAVATIFILLNTITTPIVNGIDKDKKEMVRVTCRICTFNGTHKITTQLPIDRVMKIQNEQDNEILFSLLKECNIIPKNSSISFLKNKFQKEMVENPLIIKNLKEILMNSDESIFFNLLCITRVDWSYGTKFFAPLFMLGNSPVRGWLNFPIWMIFGWLLQPFFEVIPRLASLLFISLLIPSSDIVNIGIGGRFGYDVETIGLLGKRTFDNHYKPLIFSLVGFHGYHITFEFPHNGGGWYRQDTFIGFTLATIILPQK